jgi:dTDP-4-amino-4,6-dideoxygalactose transaminase
MSTTTRSGRLAIDGGPAAVTQPIPPMYPGGMRIDEAEEWAVLEVLRTKRLFRYYGPQPGPSKVAELEEAFAQYMGTRYALAVASGTTALTSALAGLGVGPGDEVIVPAYTWISTAASVIAMGAVPVIAEVDESLTLEPRDFEAKISEYTKAVIPVHMRGTPCAMDAIMDVARRHRVSVVEDTAQANGASYHGRRLGSIGDAGIFSLQFNKIMTAGEGGMVVTDDETQHERETMYHDVAASQRSKIPQDRTIIGINCRLSELQGAVALVQLAKLDRMLADSRRQKRALKRSIADAVESKTAGFRKINDEGEAAISLVFYMDSPDTARYVARALDAEGVGASVLFDPDRSDYHVYYHWSPILRKRYWGDQGPWVWAQREVSYSPDMCPRTLDLLGRAVHINVSPDLTDRNVEEMAEGINKVLDSL